MKILAIDLGKCNSVSCLLDTNSGELEYRDCQTRWEPIRRLVERIGPDRVVIEICPQAGWIHDLMITLQIPIEVADTTQAPWQWKHVKRKTDRDDALKLARLSAIGQLNLVYMPSPRMRQWRRLIEQRHTLVAEQTRCKNRIRAILLQEERQLSAGKRGWSRQSLQELSTLACPLAACSPEELWRGMLHVELQHLEQLQPLLKELTDRLDQLAGRDKRVQLVQTIPGVGTRTAEILVATIDDPARFKRSRQLASYAGLTPRRFQSGQMDRQGHISKRGSRRLRQLLNQAAWIAVRYNEPLRMAFERISGHRPGRRKLAIVAVMRKLLLLAWALLRDGKVYRSPCTVSVA